MRTILFISLYLLGLTVNTWSTPPSPEVSSKDTKNGNKKIQVVFLLDATGSMSGLIGTAKEKIWSIAGSLSQAGENTQVEIGMVFYRDRGDVFITRHIPLGTAMDDLYEELMTMQANGGDDLPESVNQALWEGVTAMNWDKQTDTYRSIFLVGDCPPHMDYKDDVKYPESCNKAVKQNIIINTILMGNNTEARKIWTEIATRTNGEFLQTDMKVNDINIATPYDEKISTLQSRLDKSRIYYGKQGATISANKEIQSEKIATAGAAVNARRADFVQSKTGKKGYYGKNELINDVINGKKLADIPKEDLPKSLQNMPVTALENYVNTQIAERKVIETEIVKLSKQRQEYINNETKKMHAEKVENSFDNLLFHAVQKQAGKQDIKIDGAAKR